MGIRGVEGVSVKLHIEQNGGGGGGVFEVEGMASKGSREDKRGYLRGVGGRRGGEGVFRDGWS